MAEMDAFDPQLADVNAGDGFNEDAASAGLQPRLWRRLFGYVFVYKRDLVLLGLVAVATALVEAAFPLIAKGVVDDVEASGANAAFALWGLLYLACNLVMAGAVGALIWLSGKIEAFASHDIRAEAFANLQRLSFSYYDRRPTGWLMARLTADCNRLTDILAWAFLDVVWGLTMMLGIAGAMLVMNWRLALVAFVVVPVVGWVSAKFRKRILASARQVRSTNSLITGAYNESIMGVLTTKAFVREKADARDFGKLTKTMYRASVRNLLLAAIYVPIVLLLAALATNLTLVAGGTMLHAGALGIGTLIAFMMLARHFFDPVESIGHWFAEMQMAQAAAERVLSLIDATPEVRDSEQVAQVLAAGQTHSRPPGVAADGGPKRITRIELRGVGFAYEGAKPVLSNIDLGAEMNETIAIVGPTGGGKSTLVNIICRFYEPTTGQVLLDGRDYRERSLHWLQSNLGVVLQNAHVFSGTIRDNIRYGRLTASEEEIEWSAKLAGAHDFIIDMERGYDTEVGEGGGRLSAGQKQLVSFARAILAEPQILVMDEATSSVDTETELKIQQGLKFVLQGRISFVIAHRLSTIRGATRIVVVDGGRIVESGDHATLLTKDGHYAALYRQQSLDEATRRWEAKGEE